MSSINHIRKLVPRGGLRMSAASWARRGAQLLLQSHRMTVVSSGSVRSFSTVGLRSTLGSWAPSLRTHSKAAGNLLGHYTIRPLFLGSGLLVTSLSLRRHCTVAECKAKTLPKRPVDAMAKTPPFDWSMFWELIKPDIWTLIGAVCAAFGAAFVNVRIPRAISLIVNVLANKSGAAALKGAAVNALCLYLANAGLTFAYVYLLSIVGENLCERVRNRLYKRILAQDICFFDSHKSGEIVMRLTEDVQTFKSSFKQVVSLGLRNFTQALGSLVSMAMIDRTLTMLLVTFVPLVIMGGTQLGQILRRMSLQAQQASAKATATAGEVISNIRTVRAFGMEDEEQALFESQTSEVKRLSINLGWGIGLFSGGTNLFINGMVLGVLYGGGIMMNRNELSPGDLMAFLVAAQTIQRSLSSMSVLMSQVVKGLSAGSRVFEYIKIPTLISLKDGKRLDAVLGDISFQNVSFEYPSRPERRVLQSLNLDLKAGTVLALCGQSGGGKSTIAGLLERFYDPTKGSIKIDGVDLRDLNPTWLRRDVLGFINQDPVLFATTVLENIRYGRPGATDEEVYEAARKANAHGFIQNFPAGYSTIMGERGVTVSGGQRQRIAIARALLKNPAILILDEATSALDAESEHLVQDALNTLQKGRTVVVIAHRLSTIQNADKIAVVHQGEIVESGTHDELMAAKGAYAKLQQHQLS